MKNLKHYHIKELCVQYPSDGSWTEEDFAAFLEDPDMNLLVQIIANMLKIKVEDLNFNFDFPDKAYPGEVHQLIYSNLIDKVYRDNYQFVFTSGDNHEPRDPIFLIIEPKEPCFEDRTYDKLRIYADKVYPEGKRVDYSCSDFLDNLLEEMNQKCDIK